MQFVNKALHVFGLALREFFVVGEPKMSLGLGGGAGWRCVLGGAGWGCSKLASMLAHHALMTQLFTVHGRLLSKGVSGLLNKI